VASQPHAEVHFKFFQKQLHSAVLHFYLHPQVTSSRQASRKGGGQSWPQSLYASWFLLPGTGFGGRCDIYMFLVCLQPDLSLVVCSCSMELGISGWRQHLQSLAAFSEEVKLACSTVGCAGVPYRWQTNCSIDARSPSRPIPLTRSGWFWKIFQHFFFPWPLKDEVESQPVRAWKLSRLYTTGLASLSYTACIGNISTSLLFQRSSALQLLSLTWNGTEEAKHLCLCRWPALFRDLR